MSPSLIGAFGSSCILSIVTAPMDHLLLSAIDAWSPHNGVRRTRRFNLSLDLQTC